MFCKHKWELITETVTKSTFQHAIESLGGPDNLKSIKLPWQLSDGERKHIQILQCSKCGKLKRFVESI